MTFVCMYVCTYVELLTSKAWPLLVIDHMDKVACRAAERGLDFKLREGFSAETSGRWLLSVKRASK